MKLKICGMRDEENIRQVAACSPDFMGFIFYPGSPRYVSNDFKIPSDFSNSVERVGVFVAESTDSMVKLAKLHKLSFIQLHGGEPAAQCKELKQQGFGVIKVFSMADAFDFQVLKNFVPVVDYFLFDTKSIMHGGSGKTFDWSLLNRYTEDVPFFLSGGLTLQNVDSALNLENKKLAGLDINSGLELKPGLKDVSRVRDLIVKLKDHNNH